MVPREVIDEIRNRIDIVRLVGEAVPLKKVGRNHSGLCPFHKEKTPSFTVSDSKQLYHCFGCGEGGTAIDFVMKFHHLTFPEALERLAPVAGIDLAQYRKEGKEFAARKEEARRLLQVIAYAREVYHRAFMQSDSAADARTYAKKRGLTAETARRLKLGFAPPAWDSLVTALKRDKQSLEDAVKAGLIGPKQGGHYDLFRSRLLFPIENPKGETVGFGGRILGDGAPKYLNSPQTLLFDKGRMLYGLHAGQDAISHEKKILIVEGYMDQVALAEAGFRNAVATLGTALTDDHAQLLKKYTDQVVVIFDGDAAGLKAARRSMRPLLSHGLNAKVAVLPQGVDPDVFVHRQGAKAFADLVENAEPMLKFFVRRFYKTESDVSQKAVAIEELVAAVQATSSIYVKEALVDEAVKETGLDPKILRGETKPQFRAMLRPVGTGNREARRDLLAKEELTLLRLAAEVSRARDLLLEENVFRLFGDPVVAEAARAWVEKLPADTESQTAASLLDDWEHADTRPLLAAAFVEGPSVMGAWERVWSDCLKKLRRREITRLSHAVGTAEDSGDDAQVEALQRELQELKKQDESQEMRPRSAANRRMI